jgi:single-strand DNA-binding protein
MASFNKVILVGNLTRDPELRYTPKGTAVAKIGMAVNHAWTTESGEKKEEVTFVDVDVFGRTAENVGQYMRKGSPMLVEGRLKLHSWDDKETGKKRYQLAVVGESIQFLNRRESSGEAAESSAPAPAAKHGKKPAGKKSAAKTAPDAGGEPEDDVPF